MSDLPIPAVLAVDEEPFTDEDLDDALAEPGSADGYLAAKGILSDRHPTRFVVDGERSAEWAARKYASEMAVVADVKARADEWRQRINDWEQAETKRARGRAAFFEERLTGYLAVLRRESEYVKKDGTVDYRVKSVSLPSATLRSTKRPARVKVAETEGAEAQAVAWCEQNAPDAVKRSLLVSKLTGVEVRNGAALTVDGEVVPGLTVEPESVTYKVNLP